MVTNRKVPIIAGVAAVVVITGVVAGYYYFGAGEPTVDNTSAQDNNNRAIPKVLPVNSTFEGVSYSEWTAKWWQWLVSTPIDKNPAADATGEFCAENQSGPVWFLAGTFGGPEDRTCEIPKGKAVLFPLINSVCDSAEYLDLQTESEWRSCAKSANDQVTELYLSINGVELNESELRKYRVDSPVFNLTLPENNVFGVDPQTASGVSDGYWVFLESLDEDTLVHFRGTVIDTTDPTGASNFISEAKYQITVS